VRVARTASVPERRRLPDGRIDYDARSEPLPVTLSLTSPALGPGTWTTQVLALGTARLEVRFAWDGSEGRLLELSQPAIHDLPSEETEP